jgi:7-carboxy-7-deazaguanine synthase
VRVAEVFGPTIQGEGPSTGRRAGFVRLGGCNLSCSWCDTPYTWDWSGKNGTVYDPSEELYRAAVAELVDQVLAMDVPLAVITGGEPLVQAGAVTDFATALVAAGMDVEIETNGTLVPPGALLENRRVRFNVAPKLANSGDPENRRVRLDALRALASRPDTAFKFVVCDTAELDEVADLVERAGVPAAQVWLMPEGTDAATLDGRITGLAEAAIERGWNLTTRLHVLAWGNRRAV